MEGENNSLELKNVSKTDSTGSGVKSGNVLQVTVSQEDGGVDSVDQEPGEIEQARAKAIGISFQSRTSKFLERRRSTFCELLSTAFSEESRLNEEKAAELETRLKTFVSAFSTRVKKTKEEIRRPPTPSSEESDSDVSAASEPNLNERLKVFSPAPSEDPSRQRSPAFSIVSGRILRGILQCLSKTFRVIRCSYVLDPQSNLYITWLFLVSLWFVYNAWVLPLRVVFPYQTERNLPAWIVMDCIADFIYLIDIVGFKTHTKYIQHGFWVKQWKQTFKFYIFSRHFVIDLLALFPLDMVFTFYYTNTPWLRLPRLLKVTTFWELFRILDNILSSPHTARIARTLIYMLYMIHLNATAYYALSRWEGIDTTEWTFDGKGNAYIKCFYFATKTAASIGKNPKPENEIEYIFMTCAWLSGVFVFAVLIGQIRDIVATATKTQTEYRQVCYATDNYMQRFDIPSALQHKVKSWLSYTWEQQKTLDESKILAQLPQKMQADIALHVHIDTLSKVKLFQNCEVAFLRDLVVKLRSIIFLPGDFVCRKGEVGKEMYIVKTGKVHVVGGSTGSVILATLQEGAVFGEIALLAIGGMNKRTADVRSAGFANLFVLSKGDLNEAIKDYPQAQESMRKKAKKFIREQAKKAKADAAQKLEANYSTGGSQSSIDSDKLIIKDKSRQPRLLSILLKAVPKNSKTAMYMKYGSKAGSASSLYPRLESYPPSPFLPAEPGHLGHSLSFNSDSSDDQNYFPPSPPPPPVQTVQHHQGPTQESDMKEKFSFQENQDDSSQVELRVDEFHQHESTSSQPAVTMTQNSPLPEGTDGPSTSSCIYTTENEKSVPRDRAEEISDEDEIRGLPSLGSAAAILTLSSKWKKKSSSLQRQFSVNEDEGLNDGDGDDSSSSAK